jgi:hypothetical protein
MSWDQMNVSGAINYLRDHLTHEHIQAAHENAGRCELCECRNLLVNVIAKANRMYRSEKSMVTERVRRENEELKLRLRITTELLEGKTPTV